MAHLSQRQAAQQWGIAWSTFRRAVKAGKVSVDADKRVELSEMIRAFGEPPAQPAAGASEPDGTSPEPAAAHALEIENARLRAELEAARELVRRADAERDRAIETMRLLTHDRPTRRRFLGLF